MESAPRVQLAVTAQDTTSILALPDTDADICVGGLDFLTALVEYPENLLPAELHSRAANGNVIRSVGVLPVSLTLGEITTAESIHILPDIKGLPTPVLEGHETVTDHPWRIPTANQRTADGGFFVNAFHTDDERDAAGNFDRSTSRQ